MSFFVEFKRNIYVFCAKIRLLMFQSEQGSLVRVGNRYDRTFRGSNPGGGEFPHPYRPALVPNILPIKWVPGPFPGGKTAGAWSLLSTPI
jgi:hypothetical protein